MFAFNHYMYFKELKETKIVYSSYPNVEHFCACSFTRAPPPPLAYGLAAQGWSLSVDRFGRQQEKNQRVLPILSERPFLPVRLERASLDLFLRSGSRIFNALQSGEEDITQRTHHWTIRTPRPGVHPSILGPFS